MTHQAADENTWLREASDFVRAFSGAYLFGVPLLFTMEMWWIGKYALLQNLLLFLALAFALNFLLAYLSGYRQHRSLTSDLEEAVGALAVGVLAAAAVLIVLRRIVPGDPLAASLGQIIVQAVPLSLGASVANSLFAASSEGDSAAPPAAPPAMPMLLHTLGATLAGGVFIGFSIAPIDEVVQLAAALDLGHALALMGYTTLLALGVLYTSLLAQAPSRRPAVSFQVLVSETALTYALALLVALVVLLLLGRLTLEDPLYYMLNHVLVLALPVALGGAAGRVLI